MGGTLLCVGRLKDGMKALESVIGLPKAIRKNESALQQLVLGHEGFPYYMKIW